MEYQKSREIDPFFDDAINEVFKNPDKQLFVMGGSLGLGKALSDNEVVLTPEGFAPITSVEVGDMVIGSDGKPTRITGVFPQGIKNLYDVGFSDGSTVCCTNDHLWTVRKYKSKTWQTIPLEQIQKEGVVIEMRRKCVDGTPQIQRVFNIPDTPSCVFSCNKDDDDLPLDPYFLGVLLGDGGFTCNSVTLVNGKESIVDTILDRLPNRVTAKKLWRNNAWRLRFVGVKRCHNPLNKIIRQLGLWGKYSYQKSVPNCYKYGSIETRKALLQGLIDTDGHVLPTGNVEFCSSSKQLIDDYRTIASSLGIKLGTTCTKTPYYSYKGERRKGRESYRITSSCAKNTNKRIASITPVAAGHATCISIENEDGLFVTSGFNLTHNSTNFVMWGAYQIAQCVEPKMVNSKKIRESLWVAARENENSTVASILQLIENAIFTPEILANKNSPVEVLGSHPRYIRIAHNLKDGTFLDMRIECHGFNNDKAFNRLKTREYLGAIALEMQGIPWIIPMTLIERCGRWRTDTTRITKVIDGKSYTLSGVEGLCVVLADINIPARPHALYTHYYDVADKDSLPYLFITPPSPLIPKKVIDVPEKYHDKYPVTRFEGQDHIWFPNPGCYNMTRHFERKDDDGKNIPWTGYGLWYRELHRTDSEVRRYVLGVPDTVGGSASVYMTFAKGKETVCKKDTLYTKDVYIGFDPGKYGSWVFCQSIEGGLHCFHEINFEPADGVKTRHQFEDFVLPYIRKHLFGYTVKIIPDPAGNASSGNAESPVAIIRSVIYEDMKNADGASADIKIEACFVPNQNTESRVNCLGYFIDKGLLTLDPSLKVLIMALTGGYKYKELKSGIVSDTIDKNKFSHPAEAAQYAAVNILRLIKKATNARKSNRTIYRLRHTQK